MSRVILGLASVIVYVLASVIVYALASAIAAHTAALKGPDGACPCRGSGKLGHGRTRPRSP